MANTASQVSDAELQALRQRFPKPGAGAAIYQFAVILVINGYLLYLVMRGQTSPVAITAFNFCELLILSVIGHLAQFPVPKAQRLGDTGTSFLQRIVVLAFALVWLGFSYSISIGFDREHIEQVRNAANLLAALETLNIFRPLLLVAFTALTATIGDWAYWHRRGGLFVPQMAVSGAPKVLTLVFAPIPAMLIAAPFARNHPGMMAVAWSVVYLTVKSVMELGILAYQCIGMPSAAPKKRAAEIG